MKNKCAIGTWGWGTGLNGSKMIFGTAPKKEQLADAFNSAAENGLLLFDTAPVYGFGTSEAILGELSESHADFTVSTKYFPQKRALPADLRESLRQSLLRLKRPYADVLWLHQPVNIESNINTMAELFLEGKIKNIGISNADISQVQIAENVLSKYNIKLYGVQNHYSLLYRNFEKDGLLDYCKNNGIEFWAYMLLEQGALTGRKKLPPFSRRGMAFSKSKIKKLSVLTDKMSELADKYNTDIAGIAVAHACSKGMLPIVGATKPLHVQRLARSVQIELLPEETSLLEELAQKTGISIRAAWEKG